MQAMMGEGVGPPTLIPSSAPPTPGHPSLHPQQLALKPCPGAPASSPQGAFTVHYCHSTLAHQLQRPQVSVGGEGLQGGLIALLPSMA